MNRKVLAATCLAAVFAFGFGVDALAFDRASDREAQSIDWSWPADPADRKFVPLDNDLAVAVGPWTFTPAMTVRHTRTSVFGTANPFAGEPDPGMAVGLGFRGAARVDSRIGPIYSRLSLSFEHEFRAHDHQVITGLSGSGPYGFYRDRSEVDVLAAQAVFARRMSDTVFGFLGFGTEVEPGGSTDHQVTVRLRFDF